MKLADYPWISKHYEKLVEPFLQGHAHHALLLRYVSGSGEDVLVTTFIQRLLCQNSINTLPCHQCHSCKLFESSNHPDYYLMTNEKGKSSIGVDQIRNIVAKLYEKAQQGGNKVIWISPAELMTEAASNALLKTLEEPPENTYFILSYDHNSKLLPTIHSRCFSYFLSLPDLTISIAWLQQQYPEYSDNEIATALLLNEKAPLAAKMMLLPEKWQLRQQFCKMLLQYLSNNDYWLLVKQFDNEQCLERVGWFCLLLSDALKAKQKAGHFIINRDQVPLIRLLANHEHYKITALYDLWLTTREKLLTINGLNKELLIYNTLAQSELITM